MADNSQPAMNSSSLSKVILMVGFMGIYALVVLATWLLGGLRSFELPMLDLILLGLATMRLGRMIAFDRIAEPLRVPFTKTVPDRNGAGSIVVPRGSGVRRSLGEMISCPICIGTWVAAFLVYGMLVLPAPTRVLVAILAVTGAAELLHSATEALCWTGINARTQAGAQIRAVQGVQTTPEDGEDD